MKSEGILAGVSYFLRATLLLAAMGALVNESWTVLFASSLAFLLTFLPALIENNYKVFLPAEFEIILVLFVYAALFLGEVHGYYTLFWWWDIIIHIGSGLVLGFVGFLLVYVLYREKKIVARPAIIVLLSFCFALAMGTVWEIFEFSMDSFFGLNMQKSGLIDTMWDLIVDAGGALLASVLGYIYLKGGRAHLFKGLVEKFAKENPKMFRK